MASEESACKNFAYQIGCPRKSESVRFCEFRGEWNCFDSGKCGDGQ